MKILYFSIIAIASLISSFEYSSAQKTFETYKSKDALESDAKKIIAYFNTYIKNMGFNPSCIPGVSIQTEPFLIKWDDTNKAVILPYWDDLSDEQKNLFKSWRGENAEEFFVSLFNWFFIPHELGHFIDPTDNRLNHYKSERTANEFAIAFFISNKENLEKISSIRSSLQEVLETLPKIDFNNMSEEEYFNSYYSELGNDPNLYGYFQFRFILDILNNQKNLNIRQYLEN